MSEAEAAEIVELRRRVEELEAALRFVAGAFLHNAQFVGYDFERVGVRAIAGGFPLKANLPSGKRTERQRSEHNRHLAVTQDERLQDPGLEPS